ncbi:hypothetical protein BDKNPLJD_00316 [Lactobacillus helveticus]|uniref:Uncharacterized protein n=2 Tax=Lactobacillus helveticus TaxID=1587 RepID=A0A2X0R8T3_LACHE|nr:hypothetical protein lhe_1680 [Lactobacillus helveticus CNRZ32]CDI59494.1 Putative uncharacterized protein [Lactobacillus helveticus CIRM-BIA 104]CDI63438.1 Putative uncharacterized protein [Lactobacillus helveticus CIRM-BIA 103]SPS13522.1 hypothetical protein BDKNPLJD_00316 [Lactobacillus helveticus]BCD37907.1 hypothetical protein LBHL_04640 [Lactobacillus helveticus]
MVNILEKGFNHVGLRLHFFDTFVWDVCVGFADLHRSSRQKNKNAAQFDNFGRVIE